MNAPGHVSVAEATEHQRRFHQRARRHGSVPNPTPQQLQAARDARRAEALDALGDTLSQLGPEARAAALDRVDELQRRAAASALSAALPPKQEPVPHGIEACGWPTSQERRVLDEGRLVRVRSDRCNHPRCRFARLPEDRHARIHERARPGAQR